MQTKLWLALPVALALVSSPAPGFAQTPPQPETEEVQGRVRVPTSYANVHMGPSSGQQILVLVPLDTELEMIGRRGEWIQVRLTPELRETGMVMRWYENEDNGWMHDSTVEILDE